MIGCYLNKLMANWDASATVALVAVGVAVWAAVSARASAKQARISNENFFFRDRYSVYVAFEALLNHLKQNGSRPDLSEVAAFRPCVAMAKVVFSEELSSKINDYFCVALRLADEARVASMADRLPAELAEDYKRLKNSGDSLLKAIGDDLKKKC